MQATFRHAAGNIRPNIYTAADDQRATMASLNNKYGTSKSEEKTEADTNWKKLWNPTEPFETMFLKFEELFVCVVIASVPYTGNNYWIERFIASSRRAST